MCICFFSERSDRNGGRRSWTEEASKRTRESRSVAVREVAEKSLFLCVVPHPSTFRFAHPIQLFPRARPRGTTPPRRVARARGAGVGGQKKGEETRRKGGGLKKRKGLAPHSFASPRASSSSAACGDCSSVHPSEPDARNSALGAVPASQYQGLQSEPEGEAIRP